MERKNNETNTKTTSEFQYILRIHDYNIRIKLVIQPKLAPGTTQRRMSKEPRLCCSVLKWYCSHLPTESSRAQPHRPHLAQNNKRQYLCRARHASPDTSLQKVLSQPTATEIRTAFNLECHYPEHMTHIRYTGFQTHVIAKL